MAKDKVSADPDGEFNAGFLGAGLAETATLRVAACCIKVIVVGFAGTKIDCLLRSRDK
jgi:hypothetical protein